MNEFKRNRVVSMQNENAAKIKSLNTNLEWIIREGEPAEEISRFAYEKNADFLVLGDGGWSHFRKMLLGSVCSTVVHQAPCNVIIVKHSQRSRHEWAKQHGET